MGHVQWKLSFEDHTFRFLDLIAADGSGKILGIRARGTFQLDSAGYFL
jgi:hypothetical protein